MTEPEVFDEMKGFPKGVKLGEDFILWVSIALKHNVAFLNKPLAYYNQDVDVANRGVGHLHKPEEHMLWNLGFMEEVEKINPDYKQLMWDYLKLTDGCAQTPHSLKAAFALHNAFNETGDMRNVDWSKYE